MNAALHAYGRARAAASPRSLEADIFLRVNGALRGAADEVLRARALADNRRLWCAVDQALRDPANALPLPLRAQILSLGRAVLRELDAPEPDGEFLIRMNENLAAGLAGG
ncbi:flagellar biosynthesis regulator FlaF [Roseomonas elaeocarpi]|uniref:Flagellar biosynthesis regulator FlaF n=1 Tax=Roseomonas elaeocarpi TaxID=907779 RepID=A0ABV6JSN6_9PROT